MSQITITIGTSELTGEHKTEAIDLLKAAMKLSRAEADMKIVGRGRGKKATKADEEKSKKAAKAEEKPKEKKTKKGKGPGKKEVKAALAALVEEHGTDAGANALAQFEAEKLGDLDEKDYPKFIKECEDYDPDDYESEDEEDEDEEEED